MPLPFIIGGLAAIGSAIGGIGAAAAGTAAAIGTAAAGAATAVGSAVAGTAVGSAAIGAATTVGSAVAGSAVGTAAIGAMSTVGTTVGAAAGTVASAAGAGTALGAAAGTVASVTGTATGAAALGTITTAGAIGAANGISGAAKLSEASNIKDAALSKYDRAKTAFEKAQAKTNDSLKSLGERKLKIWKSFERFSVTYSKIQNPPKMDGKVDEESLTLSPDELNQIKAVAIGAKDMLAGGATSIAAGNLIGLAASSGLVSMGSASTGIALSALHGAAATNASLAALGGGSLAAGGAGMAGGAAVLGGLTVAPMLMVGGIMLNGKGNKALENAKDIKSEVDEAARKMSEGRAELKKVSDLSEKIHEELVQLHHIYDKFMSQLEAIVSRETNYEKFSDGEQRTLEKTVLSLKLLKKLSMQNILDPKSKKEEIKILTEEVNSTIQDVRYRRVKEFGEVNEEANLEKASAIAGNLGSAIAQLLQ